MLKDGKITIEPEEADVVRKIYDMYLSGSGRVTIAQNLNRRGYLIVSISRGIATILYILSNERYTGDSIWQKTYQTNVLPREHKRNNGEIPQYYAKTRILQ